MKKFTSLILVIVILMSMITLLTGCGGEKASKGLEFTSNGDGSCTWTGLGTCTDTEIIVPKKNGKETVVSVGENVLNRKKGITKLTLPDTVKTIEELALAYNDDLLEINFGTGLETIEKDGVSHCRKLQKADLPKGLKTIGERAFASDESLTEIIIPEGIEKVGTGAFNYTKAVKKISIPSSMNEFSTSDFYTDALEELELKAEMKYFSLSISTDTSGNISVCGGLCIDPQKTQYPKNYGYECNDDNIASVICTLLDKETIKLNGENVSPSSNIETGSYSHDDNFYSFEITETQELVVLYGIVENTEIARLKYELNNETKAYSAQGIATLQNATANLNIVFVPFTNSFLVIMNIADTNGAEPFNVEGVWKKS